MVIKYIGSKRRLLPTILDTIASVPGVETVLDLFSGTSRVGHALKRRGYRVVANDHNDYAWTLARCYVQADADRVGAAAARWLERLARATPHAGWFTRTFAEEARYLTPENAARVEGIRRAIAEADLEPDLEAVLLTSLLEAADRVDSTTGVQMAYLKRWAPRALRPLELRCPEVLPGRGLALRAEAWEAAAFPGDLAYLDPPYNRHSYLGNYHVWETLVRFDDPGAYGVARKRMDCRERKSPFNSKVHGLPALERTLDALRTRWALVSFSDEGHVGRDAIEAALAARGRVVVHELEQPRYVGARIGIYNPRGERVGTPGHATHREMLFLLDRDPPARPRRRASDAARLGPRA